MAAICRRASICRRTERIGRRTDLASVPKVSAAASEFSEDVALTNSSLVQGYKRIQNEL